MSLPNNTVKRLRLDLLYAGSIIGALVFFIIAAFRMPQPRDMEGRWRLSSVIFNRKTIFDRNHLKKIRLLKAPDSKEEITVIEGAHFLSDSLCFYGDGTVTTNSTLLSIVEPGWNYQADSGSWALHSDRRELWIQCGIHSLFIFKVNRLSESFLSLLPVSSRAMVSISDGTKRNIGTTNPDPGRFIYNYTR